MIGSWKWNAGIGAAVMLITFAVSSAKNVLTAALMDSLYAFVLMFAAMYGFRWLLGTAAGLKPYVNGTAVRGHRKETAAGTAIDVKSEPDEDVNRIIKDQLGGPKTQQSQQTEEFTPLNPPRYVSKAKLDAQNLDPQTMADSIRRLSEGEEGER